MADHRECPALARKSMAQKLFLVSLCSWVTGQSGNHNTWSLLPQLTAVVSISAHLSFINRADLSTLCPLLFCCAMESVDFKTFQTIFISQCFIYMASYHHQLMLLLPLLMPFAVTYAEMIVLKHPRNSKHGVGTVPRKSTLATIFCKSKNSLDI